ncbi:MAG: ribosome biogenesis GTPase Der [candidate division Zixibacteria bacterium]
MKLPTVAIVGRPNVGKSSLFNRCLKQRKAVVDAESGVTRDRNYAECDWAGRTFFLVDTGGIVPGSDNEMEKLIVDQVEFALDEADVVMLVVDSQVGVDPTERKIVTSLRKTSKPVLLIANKSDNEQLATDAYEFLGLGAGEPLMVSATIGLGIGEMLDAVVALLPEVPEDGSDKSDLIKVAVVGRPNGGKSSLINKLIGSNRLIVSEVAGTTRDAVDTPLEIEDRPFRYTLVDTAGLRRKYKVHESLEFFTTLRTARAIDNCDVAVIMVDAVAGLSVQDQHVIDQVVQKRRAGVLVINKWDLVEKDGMTAVRFEKDIKERIAKFDFLPIIFISALTGQRVIKLLDLVDRVYTQFNRRVTTSVLNDFLGGAFAKRKPPSRRNKYIQLKYITQSETSPPTFIVFSNHPELIDKSYIRYLSNQIRSEFGFVGVPFRLKFRRS